MNRKNLSLKVLSLLLAVIFVLHTFPGAARAAESDEIRDQIAALESDRDRIQSELDTLQSQQNENWASIEEMVAYKNSLDGQIFLLYSEMENLDALIRQYTLLIAQTQQELDQAQEALEELNRKFKERVRTMEEEGSVSYWSVLFKSRSFIDFIDHLNMIREISEADQRMIRELDAAAQAVEESKLQLESEKKLLEQSRTQQEAAEEELAEKRAEADRMLQQLNANQAELEALYGDLHAQKDAYIAQIAQAEREYNEAKAREEEERRRQEEAAAATRPTQPPEETPPESGEEEDQIPSEPDDGWLVPCSYVYISSPYGERSSGFHNGVDFAAYLGTPIYATRSGTVTKAVSLTYSYGNHVVVNHGDGYSSLYAHMSYYVVSAGDYVNQGQLIGYVGSTGNSSGNHLHFTVFYNGITVNPMDYL